MDKLKIVEALSKVKDPVTGQDIISMNMLCDFKVEGNNVNFTLELPKMDYPSKSELNFACIAAVQEVYPQAVVNVHTGTAGAAAKPKAPAGSAAPPKPKGSVPHIKNIIAVASGKGGVGKSTVASNLALGLKATGARVGLMDADLYGPSIPTMFGLQGQRPKVQEVYGQARLVPLMAHGISLMSIGFIIEPEQAVVLRGPRLGAIIKQFFNECIWPELDYLIIDLPPGTGDIQLTLVQTVPVTGAIIVTTPQDVAVADAIKAMSMFMLPNINVPILGVVENMSWFTPEELPDNKYYIFGEGGGDKLAVMAKAPLLGQIPLIQSVREGADEGKPVMLNPEADNAKAFMAVAKATVASIEKRNRDKGPSEKVEMIN
ncbi:MAG: ATP-binding protein involved in chromosome partitioning [Polaribacter sp.]|jgi:ATP-binding protein involved in chromosome partitioning